MHSKGVVFSVAQQCVRKVMCYYKGVPKANDLKTMYLDVRKEQTTMLSGKPNEFI